MENFTEFLRKSIKESGMSFGEIARATELNISTVSRFVHGKTDLKLTTADRILAAIKSHKATSTSKS